MTELSDSLDAVRSWLARFVIVPEAGDLDTMTLWVAHTHALELLDEVTFLISCKVVVQRRVHVILMMEAVALVMMMLLLMDGDI